MLNTINSKHCNNEEEFYRILLLVLLLSESTLIVSIFGKASPKTSEKPG